MGRVLVACEYSQIVTQAFRDHGHEAYSCDVLPTEGRPEWHFRTDALKMIGKYWDMIIAHPPCTYLCNSGVRWLHERPERWKQMRDGARFFKKMLEANSPRVCVENPVMHKYAVEIIGRRQDQSIQPWQFGEDASKRTCLWLKGLPLLIPTEIIKKKRYANQSPGGSNKIGPSPDRWKERSKTYQGIAEAMAKQWGGLLDENP